VQGERSCFEDCSALRQRLLDMAVAVCHSREFSDKSADELDFQWRRRRSGIPVISSGCPAHFTIGSTGTLTNINMRRT